MSFSSVVYTKSWVFQVLNEKRIKKLLDSNMNVSKRSLKGLDLGDSAKVLEKKMTFFFAQPRSPAGGVPWGGKNMSICRKNKKGLVFIHSGPFGASV